MSKLAACVIVESDNRAEEFERLLKSISKHVDKVFVTVNNEPHKEIKALCDKYKCELSFLKWNKDFSEQRNFNFKQAYDAGYEFLFWADTDDTVENPEVLKKLVSEWPDGLDMYMAEYKYSSSEGYDAVNHNRERLIKFDPTRMKWVGRVHEQLIAESPAYSQFTTDFHVIHWSKSEASVDDYRKTSERNLDILLSELSEQGDKPDPRTLIQIARTYIGIGKTILTSENSDEDYSAYFKKALPVLQQYIPMSGWDEERYEAVCLLADCMYVLGDADAAEKFYHRAVIEKWDRYQAYEGLIKLHFEAGRYNEVVFWFETLASVPPPKTNHFVLPIMVNLYSKLFYVKSLFLVGRHKEAWSVWQTMVKAYGNHSIIKEESKVMESAFMEAKALEGLKDICKYIAAEDEHELKGFIDSLPRKIKYGETVSLISRRLLKPRKHKDNEVTIFCGTIGLEEWAYPSISEGIGGSEEAVINLSQELTKLGYKVTVYNMCGDLAGEYNGVTYLPYHRINPEDEFNIFISWREGTFSQDIKARINWIWLHDVVDGRQFTKKLLDNVDKVVVLSPYHRSLYPEIPDDKIFVSTNGVNMDMFNSKVERNPKRVIYTSSPERGLEAFLRVMEEVKREVPDVIPEAYYGWNNNDAARGGDPNYQQFKKMINERMEEMGMPPFKRLSHRAIAEKMLSSGILFYPTDFPEINFIGGLKAQVSGAIPVTFDEFAMKDTIKFGRKVKGDPKNPKDLKALKSELVDLLKNPEKQDEHREEMMSWARENLSWGKVAEDWAEKWAECKK